MTMAVAAPILTSVLGSVAGAVASKVFGGGEPKAPALPATPTEQAKAPTTPTADDQARKRLLAAQGTNDTFLTGKRGALTPIAAVGKQLLGQ